VSSVLAIALALAVIHTAASPASGIGQVGAPPASGTASASAPIRHGAGLQAGFKSALPATARPSPFLSGVVEGFYGPRWTVATTVHIIRFLAAHGMNTFVYAPKDDPYQRAQWATPYPPRQLAYLKTIVAAAQAAHVRFVYSVSPGLSITYSSPADRAALLAKINQIRALGVNWFMLSFDDIPTTLGPADSAAYGGSLGAAQASLADAVWTAESQGGSHVGIIMTPTDYFGLQDGPYWTTLKQDLAPSVLVAWTGPEVLSPTITSAEARQVEGYLGHRIVIWDNYPVNDYTYVQQHAPRLMLGPLMGRGPNLPGAVAGYLFNPMLQGRASEVALWTGAAYLQQPHHYDPASSWAQALKSVGGPAAGALKLLAEASDTSFLAGAPAKSGDQALSSALAQAERHGPDESNAILGRLLQQFTKIGQVNRELKSSLPDPRLYAEIRPWSTQLSLEGTVGLAAVWVLTNLHEGLPTASAADQLKLLSQEMGRSTYTLNTTSEMRQFAAWVLHASGSG
jgi:hyaluronoglucosaminidase